MTQTKPEGLAPSEEWAWDNTEPGSRQRRVIALASARKKKERPGVGGWERAEHRAVLPGEHGLEVWPKSPREQAA